MNSPNKKKPVNRFSYLIAPPKSSTLKANTKASQPSTQSQLGQKSKSIGIFNLCYSGGYHDPDMGKIGDPNILLNANYEQQRELKELYDQEYGKGAVAGLCSQADTQTGRQYKRKAELDRFQKSYYEQQSMQRRADRRYQLQSVNVQIFRKSQEKYKNYQQKCYQQQKSSYQLKEIDITDDGENQEQSEEQQQEFQGSQQSSERRRSAKQQQQHFLRYNMNTPMPSRKLSQIALLGTTMTAAATKFDVNIDPNKVNSSTPYESTKCQSTPQNKQIQQNLEQQTKLQLKKLSHYHSHNHNHSHKYHQKGLHQQYYDQCQSSMSQYQEQFQQHFEQYDYETGRFMISRQRQRTSTEMEEGESDGDCHREEGYGYDYNDPNLIKKKYASTNSTTYPYPYRNAFMSENPSTFNNQRLPQTRQNKGIHVSENAKGNSNGNTDRRRDKSERKRTFLNIHSNSRENGKSTNRDKQQPQLQDQFMEKTRRLRCNNSQGQIEGKKDGIYCISNFKLNLKKNQDDEQMQLGKSDRPEISGTSKALPSTAKKYCIAKSTAVKTHQMSNKLQLSRDSFQSMESSVEQYSTSQIKLSHQKRLRSSSKGSSKPKGLTIKSKGLITKNQNQ